MNALRIIVPLILGLIAGGINYYVVQGMVAPLELTAVRQDIKAGTEIKSEDMLTKVQVRADNRDIFRSVIPWVDRGTAISRRVNRPMAAGEVLQFADVRSEGADDIKALLKSGEISFSFPVRAARVAPGLRPGESVGLVVPDGAGSPTMAPERAGRKVLGPFRLLSLGERADPFRSTAEELRQVTVAVPVGKQGELPPEVVQLDAAASPTDGGRRPLIQAVEFYKVP